MNKLTAEKCRELFEAEMRSRFGSIVDLRICKNSDGDYMSFCAQVAWHTWQKALEIALQVLEAEPVADVVAWNHPSEERKCSVQLRRFDLKPGPLFMLPSQPPTDTYRQIENDGWIAWGGGQCPVFGDERVQVKFRSGGQDKWQAKYYYWVSVGAGDDIIAYRVIENDGREG